MTLLVRLLRERKNEIESLLWHFLGPICIYVLQLDAWFQLGENVVKCDFSEKVRHNFFFWKQFYQFSRSGKMSGILWSVYCKIEIDWFSKVASFFLCFPSIDFCILVWVRHCMYTFFSWYVYKLCIVQILLKKLLTSIRKVVVHGKVHLKLELVSNRFSFEKRT